MAFSHWGVVGKRYKGQVKEHRILNKVVIIDMHVSIATSRRYLGIEVGLRASCTVDAGMSILASSSGRPMLDSDSRLDRE